MSSPEEIALLHSRINQLRQQIEENEVLHNRSIIIIYIVVRNKQYLISMDLLIGLLAPLGLNAYTMPELIEKYENRNGLNTSFLVARTVTEASVASTNNHEMAKFRFSRMNALTDKTIFKVTIPLHLLRSIVQRELFQDNPEALEVYMAQAVNYLNTIRSVFCCHHSFATASSVNELNEFQPIYHCLLRTLLEPWGLEVTAGQKKPLQFDAMIDDKGMASPIKGFADLLVSGIDIDNMNHQTKNLRCVVELKSPLALATGNNVAGKHQVLAETKGAATFYETDHAPSGILTDLFLLYGAYMVDGKYYVTQGVYEPNEYILLLLFQIAGFRIDIILEVLAQCEEVVKEEEDDEEEEEEEEIDAEEEGGVKRARGGEAGPNLPRLGAAAAAAAAERGRGGRGSQVAGGAGGTGGEYDSDDDAGGIDYKKEEEDECYQRDVDAYFKFQKEVWGLPSDSCTLSKENIQKLQNSMKAAPDAAPISTLALFLSEK